jgi:hypothetical protein
MIRPRRMRWADYVARMKGKKEKFIKVFSGKARKKKIMRKIYM